MPLAAANRGHPPTPGPESSGNLGDALWSGTAHPARPCGRSSGVTRGRGQQRSGDWGGGGGAGRASPSSTLSTRCGIFPGLQPVPSAATFRDRPRPPSTHFPGQGAQGCPAPQSSAGWVCSSWLLQRAFPPPSPPPPAFHTAAVQGEAGLISLLPQGKLRQERASHSHARCSRSTLLPGFPTPPQPPWGSADRDLLFGTDPAKRAATPQGSKFCPPVPSSPERGGRRETAASFAMHISARVFLNISGGGGCVVFTGKSGKPR